MHFQTIGELGTHIRQQRVSPTEVLEMSLARIKQLNPALNAFISVFADSARAEAVAANAEIRAGKWRGPLHGIPVGLKDFYDMAGTTTTAGFAQFKDRVAQMDADVVKRLRGAGAVIVGKTNMDSLGMATTGLTSAFGPVRNPWDETYVCGGSSAGSAAAVAAGLCHATVDTDAVGSARLPASCCGVVGFKGSYDLISTRGILGDEPVDEFIRWMGHAGITTRSAADTALVLNALVDGASGLFDVGIPKPDRTIRVGVGNNFTAHPEIKMWLDKAAAILRNAGYTTSDIAVPFGDPGQADMKTIKADRASIAQEAFSRVDVILLPTLKSTVPTVKEASRNPEQGVSAELTAFANYYGLPAASIPCGFDSHNMPVGLQFVGRPHGESTVLDIAHQYELMAGMGSSHPLD